MGSTIRAAEPIIVRMTKEHRPTFTELVDQLRKQSAVQQSRPLTRPSRPGIYEAGVVDTLGHWYDRTDEALDDTAALTVIRAGAVVLVDDCGCGGGCGYQWPTVDQLAALVAAGPIQRHKKDAGSYALYRHPESGRPLLLVSEPVRWLQQFID